MQNTLRNIAISDRTLETKVIAQENSIVPIVQNQVTLSITNTSSKAQVITMLLPIWYADPTVSSEKVILENIDLKITANDKPVKLKATTKYEDPTHWFAKLFTWDLKLAAKQSLNLKIQYKLFMSTVTLSLHEVFPHVYANELDTLNMGPVIGVNVNYAHNMDLELPSKIAIPLPGVTKISCDLTGLKDYLKQNKYLLAFLQQETESTQMFNHTLNAFGVRTVDKAENWDATFNPLRIVELRDFPASNNKAWDYSWDDNIVNFFFEAYVLILPTTFEGMQDYYKHYEKIYDPYQRRMWREQLRTLYQKANSAPVNDPEQVEEILNFLH